MLLRAKVLNPLVAGGERLEWALVTDARLQREETGTLKLPTKVSDDIMLLNAHN